LHSANFCIAFPETFRQLLRLYEWRIVMMVLRTAETTMSNGNKLAPIIEDLRNHSAEQVAELHMLLNAGMPGRPDPRRPGFFEMDGVTNVYYIFRYPAGHKVLLLAAWQNESDPVAELVACTCPAV
jgi:hypothetical protein